MTLLEDIKEIFQEFVQNPQYVFKLLQKHNPAGSNEYFIAILKKSPETVTNESIRSPLMINADYAEFCANQLEVILIFNQLSPKETVLSVVNTDHDFYPVKFEVGKTLSNIYSQYFNNNNDNDWTKGIKYVKTIDAAFYRGFMPDNFTGTWFKFDHKGMKQSECDYLDGKQHGKRHYYCDVCLIEDEEYFDGEHHGNYLHYYRNKQKKEERHYEHGKKVGTWTTWDDTGKIIEEITY
jgi:hypothetical protein